MFRRSIAGLILGPALLIGSLAWWGFLALRTVFDADRTETVAVELLDNEAVIDQISANIGRTLEAAMPETVQLTDEQVDAGVKIILSDPTVRDQIIGSLAASHRAFLGTEDPPANIDLGPALAPSRERIGAIAPAIAAEIPTTFVVDLPTERIPNASPIKGFLERMVPILAALSIVMALLALFASSDRSRVLRRAARWAIGTTAVYLLVGLGAPYLLRAYAPDQAEVLAALFAAVLRAAVFPSIVLGGLGVVLLLLSMFWPDGSRAASPRRAAPVGAQAPSARRPDPPVRPRPAAPDATNAMPSVPVARSAPYAPSSDATTALPSMPVPPSSSAPAVRPPLGYEPMPTPRPTLPTRAKPPDPIKLQVRPGELPGGPAASPSADPGSAGPGVSERPRWRPPTWVEGHGWVMDPDDPREPPNNARFVDGVGWVVPGPPPA